MKSSTKETQINPDSPELSNNEYDTPNSPMQLEDSSFLSNEERLQSENEMLRAQISKLWGIINKQRAVINTLQSKVPRRGSAAGLLTSRISEDDHLSNDSETSTGLLRPQLSPQSQELYLQAKKQYKRHTSIDKTLKSSVYLNRIEENKQPNSIADIDKKINLSNEVQPNPNHKTTNLKETFGLGLVNSNEDIASNIKKSNEIQDKIAVKSIESDIAQSSKLLGKANRSRNHSIKEEPKEVELKSTSKSQPNSTILTPRELNSPPLSPTKIIQPNNTPGHTSSPISRSPINSVITLESKQNEDVSKDSINTKTSNNLSDVTSFTNPASTRATDTETKSNIQSSTIIESTTLNNNDSSKSVTEQSTHPDAEKALVTHPLDKLEDIGVEVYGSAIRCNSKGKETLVFKLQLKQLPSSIRQSSLIENEVIDVPGTNLWVIEKHFSDFLNLDNKIKQMKTVALDKYSKLPEKKHWSSISPSKLDQRKFLLQQYLMRIILQIPANPDCMELICEFLNSNIIDNEPNTPRADGKMEGYLIKRGKNFGKWKRRYFILNSSVLNYYDTKNGQWLGSINLPQVQVAVQQTSNLDRSSDDNGVDTFRHAFMILEPKKNSTFSRHVLCADSDFERDLWVEALSVHMNPDISGTPNTQGNILEKSPRSSTLKSISTPDIDSTSPKKLSPTTPESTLIESEVLESESLTSSPISNIEPSETTNHHSSKQSITTSPIESQANLTNQPATPLAPPKLKTKSSKDQLTSKFLGLNKEKAASPNTPAHVTLEPNKKSVKKNFFWNKRLFGNEAKKPSTPLSIFGVNLQQSVATSSIGGYPLPSVVYRCIQYLDSKNAQEEEGIYRLSGSTTTIDSLKSKFEIEGDYDIIKSNVPYDIHAVAGLLKMFLRNLPSTVLTSELQPDFLQVTDLLSRKDRVRELGKLVCSLPLENYTLLRALVSHLLGVVEKSNINKMTLKNIGIIFAPSLGIPAGVFTLFMSEFSYIFYVDSTGSAAPRELTDDEDDERDSLSTTNTGAKSFKTTSGKADTSQFEEEFTQDSIGSNALNSHMVNLKSRSHRRVKSEDLIKVSSQEIFKTEENSNISNLTEKEQNSNINEKLQLTQVSESFPGKPLSVTSSRQSSKNGSRLLSKSSSHMNIKLSDPLSPSSQKRNRSNRNSILYQFTAPPEVVERERRLSVSIQPSDEFLEEYALNVSTVSETSLPSGENVTAVAHQ